MRGHVPLSIRLTGFYLLASTVLLLGVGAWMASAITQHFVELDRETLNDKILWIQGIASHADSVSDLRDRLEGALPNNPGLYIRIDRSDGQVLYHSSHFRFPAELLAQPSKHGADNLPLAWNNGHSSYRGMVVPWETPEWMPARPARIMAAIDTAHHTHFIADLRRSLGLYIVVGAGLSGLLGWWATQAGLMPLRRMKAKVQLVTAQRLDQRLDTDAIPVEFADLAQSLNEMLHRLQQDFERLSDFSSDLAHELRTPLNNLLTQNEVVLSRARDLETYRDTLASNSEELQRLARMVSDMLLLAKAENGLLTLPRPDQLDLAQEVRALFDFYDALAEEKTVHLLLQGHGHMIGDRLMLRRAISNLLANAVRHAPPNSDILVRLQPLPSGHLRISVANEGAPIPAEILPRLFDRFFRADRARVHLDSDGAGLGLSITQAIARAHGGQVHASSHDGRNVFCIDLPIRPA